MEAVIFEEFGPGFGPGGCIWPEAGAMVLIFYEFCPWFWL